MAPDSSKTTPLDNSRRRAAIQTALQIEEKKRLRDRIADSVIECFDLPSQPGGIPAQALPRDVALFQASLALFQPSDFDDLILERNIDKRCGYSLCSNPNKQASHQGKRVFSKEVGYFIDKSEFEQWCSKECMDRGAFVRAQLSTEPAWLREGQNAEIKLLEEMKHTGDLADAIKELAILNTEDQETALKLKALSLERGSDAKNSTEDFQIHEKDGEFGSSVPPPVQGADSIEGHSPEQLLSKCKA